MQCRMATETQSYLYAKMNSNAALPVWQAFLAARVSVAALLRLREGSEAEGFFCLCR